MLLAIANAATKSAKFDSALDRTFKDRQALQSRLKAVEVDGRFNTLGFVIADYPANYFKVNLKTDGSLHQVFVGYDLTASYSREEDNEILGIMAGWLRRVFQETDGYAVKRAELLEIVNDWEEQAVKRIVGERTAKT